MCLFLAEMLRTRRVSLRRGADIAAAIVVKLDQIQSEAEFLQLVKQLEYEFQELQHLEQDLTFYHKVSQREKLEKLVREFAIQNLPDDPHRAVALMEEALLPGVELSELTKNFPDFGEFVGAHTR